MSKARYFYDSSRIVIVSTLACSESKGYLISETPHHAGLNPALFKALFQVRLQKKKNINKQNTFMEVAAT